MALVFDLVPHTSFSSGFEERREETKAGRSNGTVGLGFPRPGDAADDDDDEDYPNFNRVIQGEINVELMP